MSVRQYYICIFSLYEISFFYLCIRIQVLIYDSRNRRENSESRTICVNGLYSKQTRANAEKEYTLAELNTAIIETWAGNIQWRTDGTSLRSTNHLTSHALRQKQSLSSKTDQTTPIFFLLIVSASKQISLENIPPPKLWKTTDDRKSRNHLEKGDLEPFTHDFLSPKINSCIGFS